MGVGPFSGRKHSDYMNPTRDINPKPRNYSILETYGKGNACAIIVKYPDCTNFEGHKIIVYPFSLSEVKAHGIINGLDPHFNDKIVITPFARFEPTNHGWAAAKDLVDLLDKLED